MSESPSFSGSPLDRASQERTDPAWIEQRLADPSARFLALWRLNGLVKASQPPELAWATRDVREFENQTTGPVLLGLQDETAHFAIDVSGLDKPESKLGVIGEAKFSDIRAVAAQLPHGEAAILAQARSLIDWHAHHSFCSNCGEPTRSVQGGTVRYCGDCRTEHFPRTNPVVIMVVVRGDRCLLGRQMDWPVGMYSALAGFVEPGETIEEAVRREVREEASVEVGTVRYQASQPWPFPSSLMIGCIGEALSERIVIDPAELQDARWFELAKVRRALEEPDASSGFFIPPPMSIAHHLVKLWVASSLGS